MKQFLTHEVMARSGALARGLIVCGAVMLGVAGVAGCGNTQKQLQPTLTLDDLNVTYESVKLTQRSLQSYTMLYTFAVANNGATAVTVSGAMGSFTFCGAQVASPQNSETQTISPGATMEVPVTVTVPFPSEFEALRDYLNQGTCAFELKGEIMSSAGPLPIGAGGSLDLPKLPTVSIESGSIAIEGKDEWAVTFDIAVDNSGNAFEPRLNYLTATLSIFGRDVFKLDQPIDTELPSSSKASFGFTARISGEGLTPEQKMSLQTSKTLDYGFTGAMKIDKFVVPFEEPGTFKFSR